MSDPFKTAISAINRSLLEDGSEMNFRYTQDRCDTILRIIGLNTNDTDERDYLINDINVSANIAIRNKDLASQHISKSEAVKAIRKMRNAIDEILHQGPFSQCDNNIAGIMSRIVMTMDDRLFDRIDKMSSDVSDIFTDFEEVLYEFEEVLEYDQLSKKDASYIGIRLGGRPANDAAADFCRALADIYHEYTDSLPSCPITSNPNSNNYGKAYGRFYDFVEACIRPTEIISPNVRLDAIVSQTANEFRSERTQETESGGNMEKTTDTDGD